MKDLQQVFMNCMLIPQRQQKVLKNSLYSSTLDLLSRFYIRFHQFLGAWRVPLRGLQFWHEHLGTDALPDVTNGLR